MRAPKRFGYLLDPICIGSAAAYLIGRFFLRPHHIGGAFTQGYLNDVLCLPLFLPMILGVQRVFRLRGHDGPPRMWEVLQHWVIFSVLFEVVLPLYPAYFRTTADPLDVIAYLAGGLAAWGIWRWMAAASQYVSAGADWSISRIGGPLAFPSHSRTLAKPRRLAILLRLSILETSMAIEAKTGQSLRVTISRNINRGSARKTLERVFMLDKAVSKPLERRSRNFKEMPKRRGGQIWTKRPNKLHPDLARGAAATVAATPQLLRDLNSVETFVQVQPA